MRRAVSLVLFLCLALPAWAQKTKTEKLDGYAEWIRGEIVIVDGQRVTADGRTRFQGKEITSLRSIPQGYRVKLEGTRRPDGVLVASSVNASPNKSEIFEGEIKQATTEIENKWVSEGSLTETDENGKERIIGHLIASGQYVERANRIMTRLIPPYVNPSGLRVHVVETKDWNAMAMGNGAVWIFTGLLDDMNDDEVAIVLAHELAHYTHEHSRKGFVRSMWAQLIAAGVLLAANQTHKPTLSTALALAGSFTLMAWQNGYGRDLEDQADRVGLRYAYEGGFHVSQGPLLWKRFKDKYGDQNRIVNFFMGDHSQASARIRNLEREIALNYR
jgi:hypothetical protein